LFENQLTNLDHIGLWEFTGNFATYTHDLCKYHHDNNRHSIPAHRVSFWSVDDGAASTSAFTALEDAAAAAGGSVSEPWSMQISVQRSNASNDPSEILERRRTGDATKDLHVVSFSGDPSQLILVHR